MALTILNSKYYFDEGFMIERVRCPACTTVPIHSHDFVEIVYICSGNGNQTVKNNTYSISKGDVLFMNYGSTHSFCSHEGFEYVNILIKPEYISQNLCGIENAFALLSLSEFKEFNQTINTARCFMHFSKQERSHIETLIELMEKESANPSSGSQLVLRSSLDILLTTIFRKMSLPMNEKMHLDSELLQYIKDNCGEALTLKKVSAMCFYNSSYFSRAFKKYTGIGFTTYLTQCRMERARELLIDTDLRIDDIIEKCGFTDHSRFFRVFAVYAGCSPLQYRKSKK